MSPTTLRFIKTGMAFFVLGALIGVLLSLPPTRGALYAASGGRWSLAHAHFNLAGFVIMIIFGVAYHILPRFSGKPLHSDAWAAIHFWIAAAATAAMGAGFIIPAAEPLLWAGSVAQFAGIVLGIANLWLTIP